MKISKRDLILKSIIDAYIDENLPIGSSELGARMQVAIPASTIRAYFKKLSDDGEITQLHISGGRMPTTTAMKRYWSEFFEDFSDTISIQDDLVLKEICKRYELYCMIFGSSEQFFKEILNYQNRFLILNFTDDEIVLKYNEKVEKFLFNLIGVSLDKLEIFASQVGLSELRLKIRELKRGKIYFQENENLVFKMFDDERLKMIFEPGFGQMMRTGLNFAPLFEDGFMGLKLAANFMGRDAVMICSGSIYSNYIKFLNEIKEVA